MKKVLFILVAVTAICMWGCKPKATLVEPILSVDTTFEPAYEQPIEVTEENLTYPSDVLYVISREYELMQDSTSEKANTEKAKELAAKGKTMSFPQYLETRLIELYPHKAFKGMMDDLNRETVSGLVVQDTKLSIPKNEEIIYAQNSEMAKTEPFYAFVSVEDEIKFLNMSEKEKEKYLALNELADNPKFADITDFENISETDSIPVHLNNDDKSLWLDENIFLSSIMFAGGGSYVIYRVKQSKERAVHKAVQYYGSDINCGKKGDAFKHMTVSMLIKRYISEDMAYLVMDLFWENRGSNSPCDKYMDLHNNYIGRNTQYSTFRGKTFENVYDWEKWTTNVHNFVENDQNSIEKGWNKSLVEYVVLKETKTANKSKYIFWNKTSECE